MVLLRVHRGLTLFVPSSVWDWVSERWPTLHLGSSTSAAAQHSTPVDEGERPRFFDRAADGDGSPVSITRNVRGHGRDFPDVREAYSPARQRRL
jgi:hypothetical protein